VKYKNNNHFFSKNELKEDYTSEDNFETLVDLFTLLSYVFIIASIVFGVNQNFNNSQSSFSSLFEFRDVANGSGFTSELPNDMLIVMFSKSYNSDVIYLIKSGEPLSILYETNRFPNLLLALNENKDEFKNAENIQVIVDNKNKQINSELFLLFEQWLAYNNLTSIINFNETL